MIHEIINITSDGRVYLKTYIHDQSNQADFQIKKRPAIIILPGGAFVFLSDREAEPVAITFMKEGYNTFVLYYSIGDYCKYPDILEEVSKAIWEVRRHSEKWNINPDAIVLMGFSAGANIAGMSATQWNNPSISKNLGVSSEAIKPNAVVLAYGPWDNTNTIQKDPKFYNPYAGKIAKDCTPELDIINYIGSHVPPIFMWHNLYDKYVPAINPIMAATKLIEYNIPFELHIFQGGEHGMSVCNSLSSYDEKSKKLVKENPNVALWVPMCVNWLNSLFNI
ncbi:MAG: alpha/beta hydrolase [Dictyoglomaceae bacterium]